MELDVYQVIKELMKEYPNDMIGICLVRWI
jgi:hypothetical protein